jgi:hypothetical protein
MNVLSGVTGEKVGTMDKAGRVVTSDPGLRSIMAKVRTEGFVIVPDRSETKAAGTIVDYIRVVHDTDPNFTNALIVYLLREGFEARPVS